MTSSQNDIKKLEDALKKSFPGLSIVFGVDQNATQAYISIERYPEEFVERNLIDTITKLIKSTFVYGLDEAFIDKELPEIIISRNCIKDQIIAVGTPPTHGNPAEIEVLVARPSKENLVQSDGTIDFKSRDLFKCVDKDEKIAIKTPATEGIPGTSVFGTPIPAIRGRDKRLTGGKNTICKTEDNKEVIYAASEGQVSIVTGLSSVSINVYPEMRINGDVNYETGNINFKGSLTVGGSILSGFSVNVTGNMLVNGMIEPDTSVTVGGDLDVRKGILGTVGERDTRKGIHVAGNLRALYAENAILVVDGDVYLSSALNCNIMANGEIIIERSLIGGFTTCLHSVTAGSIGNMAGVQTSVLCGVSPSIYNKLNYINKVLTDLLKQRESFEKNLQFITNFPDKVPYNKSEALKEHLKTQLTNLAAQITALEADKAELELALRKEGDAKISARSLFPGTNLAIRNARLPIEAEESYRTYFLQPSTGNIEATIYQPGKIKANKPKS